MKKTVYTINEEGNFVSVEIEMTQSEIEQLNETNNKIKLYNKLEFFRSSRELWLSKYDVYSLKVIRGQIQEDLSVEEWYQTILDFPSQMTHETMDYDWPELPEIIKQLL